MKRTAVSFFVFVLLHVLSSFAATDLGSPPPDSLSVTPDDGHALFNDSFDQAKKSIQMVMFHLSDGDSVQHLLSAHQRGVSVRVILDRKILENPSAQKIQDQLTAEGIEVRASSAAFSITHQKSAVIDDQFALITSINLTKTVSFTRDFGIKSYDPAVIAEVDKVFAADWDNATVQAASTPPVGNEKLLWSPVNSKDKILALIKGAKQELFLEVENLGDADVLAALSAQATNGVHVTVIVPGCVEGADPTRNLAFLSDLHNSGVDARASVPPYTTENPYIHAKAIVVDSAEFYVGSENFSHNSLENAREVGLIENNKQISQKILETIQIDVGHAKASQDLQGFSCRMPKVQGQF